jgi:predicted ATPase
MFITRLKLKNWRNFREADLRFSEYTYILGANASGKSNLLDVFKFLRDISNPQGGGLQKAILDRGGIKKLRCLHARRDPEVRIEVHLAADFNSEIADWEYSIAFKPEGKGAQRILVSEERVIRNGKNVFPIRPNAQDKEDELRLTQTFLEQIQANSSFRDVNQFFSDVSYLHLVPQFLKYGDRIGGRLLDDDPYGQGFLSSVAKSSERVRNTRLKKIERALSLAVPQFEELKYIKVMGHPHLQARYAHHRPNAGWQQEDQFSDGTLRLLGILWSLLEGNGLLLLEEPELSLNNGIIEHIPMMMQRIQRESKRKRQVIVTTHSETLLSNKGIDANGVILLESSNDGTKARLLNERELDSITAGLSVAEVALPKTKPAMSEQLAFW